MVSHLIAQMPWLYLIPPRYRAGWKRDLVNGQTHQMKSGEERCLMLTNSNEIHEISRLQTQQIIIMTIHPQHEYNGFPKSHED